MTKNFQVYFPDEQVISESILIFLCELSTTTFRTSNILEDETGRHFSMSLMHQKFISQTLRLIKFTPRNTGEEELKKSITSNENSLTRYSKDKN